MKYLRDENGRLKKLVAELSLDKDMLQSEIPRLVERRTELRRLLEKYRASEVNARSSELGRVLRARLSIFRRSWTQREPSWYPMSPKTGRHGPPAHERVTLTRG